LIENTSRINKSNMITIFLKTINIIIILYTVTQNEFSATNWYWFNSTSNNSNDQALVHSKTTVRNIYQELGIDQ